MELSDSELRDFETRYGLPRGMSESTASWLATIALMAELLAVLFFVSAFSDRSGDTAFIDLFVYGFLGSLISLLAFVLAMVSFLRSRRRAVIQFVAVVATVPGALISSLLIAAILLSLLF